MVGAAVGEGAAVTVTEMSDDSAASDAVVTEASEVADAVVSGADILVDMDLPIRNIDIPIIRKIITKIKRRRKRMILRFRILACRLLLDGGFG